MIKKGKILWFVWAGLLVLLFLMSSTDLIIKERKVEVYPISVIIEEDSDSYYINFKKGMDQAAAEFHVDISFITLYASGDQEQQMELVKREIKDGAAAVILAPVNMEETLKALEGLTPGCPILLLGQPPSGGWAAGTVGVDGQETGRLLGEAVVNQTPANVPVCLVCRGLDYGDNAQVYEGMKTVLEEGGYDYRLVEEKDEDGFSQIFQDTDARGTKTFTIVALDVQTLDLAVQYLEETTTDLGRVEGLYGAGSTTPLTRALEKGIVTGMTAYSQFDEGYLSVKLAVEAIRGRTQKQKIQLAPVYLDQDGIRNKTYEKMLYPIE